MNNSFQQSTSQGYPLTMPSALVCGMESSSMCPTVELDRKIFLNKFIKEDSVKDAIYRDFKEIIQKEAALEEKNRLIIEYCKEYNPIRYLGTNDVLVLEAKSGSLCFCLFTEEEHKSEEGQGLVKKKYFVNMQETLGIIHKICEEKLPQKPKKTDADRIAEILAEFKACYESATQKYQKEKQKFEKIKQEYQEMKVKCNFQDKVEVENILANVSNTFATDDSQQGNLSTENEIPQEMMKPKQQYERAKQELESREATLASLKNSIQLLEELHALALAGKLDKSSMIEVSVSMSQTHQSALTEQNPANLISVGSLLYDFNFNSYYTQHIQSEGTEIEEEAESNHSISLTEIPDGADPVEEQIQKLQQENNQLRGKLIRREATTFENEEFIGMIKNGSDLNEIREYREETQVNLFYRDNKYGLTALHHAVIFPDIFKFLFESLPNQEKLACIFSNDYYYCETILHYAVRKSSISVCKWLMSTLSRDQQSQLLQKNVHQNTALDLAIQSGNLDLFKYLFSLLAEDTKVSYIVQKDLRQGSTALHRAAESKNFEIYKYLVNSLQKDKLQSIFEADDFGRTTLFYALEHKNLDVRDFFLQQLSPEGKQSLPLQKNQRNETLLHRISNIKDQNIQQLIISLIPEDIRASYILEKDHKGNTALHKGVMDGNLDMCKSLINSLSKDKKTDYILQTNEIGCSALSYILNYRLYRQVWRLNSVKELENYTIVELFQHKTTHTPFHKITVSQDSIITKDLLSGEVNLDSISSQEDIILLISTIDALGDEICDFLFQQLPIERKDELISEINTKTALALQYHSLDRSKWFYTYVWGSVHKEPRHKWEPQIRIRPNNPHPYSTKDANEQNTALGKIVLSGNLGVCQYLLNFLSKEQKLQYVIQEDKRDEHITAFDFLTKPESECVGQPPYHQGGNHARQNEDSKKNEERKGDNLIVISDDELSEIDKNTYEENLTLNTFGSHELLMKEKSKNEHLKRRLNIQARKLEPTEEDYLEFFKIIKGDDASILRRFLTEHNVDPFRKNAEGLPALHISKYNAELQKILVGSVHEEKKVEYISQRDSEGNTLLHIQAIYDLGMCQFFVNLLPHEKRDAFILQKNNQGETVLHKTKFSADIFKFLFRSLSGERRVQFILEKDNLGNTLLHKAKDKIELCRIFVNLLSQDKRIPFILEKNSRGETALHNANLDFCELLVKSLPGESKIQLILEQNNDGETILHKSTNNMKMWVLLLGAIPKDGRAQFICQKDNSGNTVLHKSIKNEEILGFILSSLPQDKRATLILEKNRDNETILHKAIKSREMCEILLKILPGEKKAEFILQQNKKGEAALHKLSHDTGICELLFESLPKTKRAQLICQKDIFGNTILHKTINNEELFKKMITLLDSLPKEKRKEVILAKNDQGETALHSAALANSKDMCEQLIKHLTGTEKKGYIFEKNANGETALHNAVVSYCSAGTQVCELLLSSLKEDRRKEYILERSKTGYTALHYAGMGGHMKKCEFLVGRLVESKRHEYINAKDNVGYTALYYAARKLCVETCKLLIQMGADVKIISKQNETALDLPITMSANDRVYREKERKEKIIALLSRSHDFYN